MKKHTLLIGPPGSGKTLWARSKATSIIAGSCSDEACSDAVHARHVAGIRTDERAFFRAPHYTVSPLTLIGRLNRHRWQPGEFSLAHAGVLFLDELPEFAVRCLNILREPLTTGFVELENSQNRLTVPAEFTLIATTNVCPCGPWAGPCVCTAEQIERYQDRIPSWLRDVCQILRPYEYAVKS